MTTVLHLHIPRTAGSSLHHHLHDALDRRAALVSGHFVWGVHRRYQDYVYFVVLREPIDRVGSLYDYIRSNPSHNQHLKFASMSLQDILKSPSAVRSHLSNGQTRLLAGGDALGVRVTEHHFQAAWAHLNQPEVVVTFTDRINEGLEQLSARLGLPIPPLQNVRNAAPRVTLGDERELVADLNSWDVALYQEARSRFTRESAEIAGLYRVERASVRPGTEADIRWCDVYAESEDDARWQAADEFGAYWIDPIEVTIREFHSLDGKEIRSGVRGIARSG